MSTALKQMTADEFLLWAEGKEGRWELHDGVPVMISSAARNESPERAAHIRTKFSAASRRLEDAWRRADCRARSLQTALRSGSTRGATYEPDATVVCGPRRPTTRSSIDNPVIVVEVLSPKHRGRSTTAASSAAISRCRASSTISSSTPTGGSSFTTSVGQSDAIETRVLSEGSVKLDPPGFEVAVEALFPPP